MPFKLELSDARRIDLDLPESLDPEQNTYVMVNQAAQREIELRAELTAEAARTYTEGQKSVKVEQRWSVPEMQRREVFLTLAGCNIVKLDGTSLFKFVEKDGISRIANETAFNNSWGLLPREVAKAIHKAVITVNPDWDPNPAAQGE